MVNKSILYNTYFTHINAYKQGTHENCRVDGGNLISACSAFGLPTYQLAHLPAVLPPMIPWLIGETVLFPAASPCLSFSFCSAHIHAVPPPLYSPPGSSDGSSFCCILTNFSTKKWAFRLSVKVQIMLISWVCCEIPILYFSFFPCKPGLAKLWTWPHGLVLSDCMRISFVITYRIRYRMNCV